ncbi:MAG: hypothetical protein DRO05_06995 [Thermoproteota archaeon]|nr:MAG: hypothetical protein DRO05_06995 [Candidatus Korarchaeota archaeon]
MFMAEFLETYQEVIRRKRLLRKLAVIYCIGVILASLGIYFELGLTSSLLFLFIMLLAWFPLKRMVRKVLSEWLREKAT